ncbi:uncharacterized protein RJT20DRAFT_29012 [Scheffersomyces xylosifermentans]|uniref:uncharacterized protein n=1 Tax=Scheffersomyces xylosifermentans TaxID=1304137 RepID=UPI00315D7C56
MADTPILSYKKPTPQSSNGSRSRIGSPAIMQAKTSFSSSSEPASPVGTLNSPNASRSVSTMGSPTVGGGTRKISSRRKALQEFYNIQQKEQEQQQDQQQNDHHTATDGGKTNGSVEKKQYHTKESLASLQDTEEMERFVKSSTIEDILKLRNTITSKLNSHDSEKKSIIYDNYYELIKLNQTLADISKAQPPPKSSLGGLGIYEEHDVLKDSKTEENYLETTLSELASFIESESSRFNDPFATIVSKIQQEDTNDADSAASVVAISDEVEPVELPSDINKNQLSAELNYLLGGEKFKDSPEEKVHLSESIQSILKSLEVHRDELLILQLNDLKKSLS